MPDLKRFYRQLGYRLGEIQRERDWEEADFKRLRYSYGSWERHRRGDAGMAASTALQISAMCGLTADELFKGTDKGIYREFPSVVRVRPYQVRDDLNKFAINKFRVQLAACRSFPEHGKVWITVDEFKIRFGWRIRRLRLERGWSSEDIGTRKGDWKTWQEWEAGKKRPKISSWVAICEVLEIDLNFLLRAIETEGDDVMSASS